MTFRSDDLAQTTTKTPPKIGAEVRFCGSAQEEVRAQVCAANDDDGTVDLALYDDAGRITGGCSRAERALVPADRIKPGCWW